MPTFVSKEIVTAEQWMNPRPCPYPLPKGVCDCGLLMSGIPGGCQAHVHPIDGLRERIDLKAGDWIIDDGKDEKGRDTFRHMADEEFCKKYAPFVLQVDTVIAYKPGTDEFVEGIFHKREK